MLQLLEKNRKKIMKKGGLQKYPRGYLGGSSKCPRLSMRGGGGSKMSKKRSTWFLHDP